MPLAELEPARAGAVDFIVDRGVAGLPPHGWDEAVGGDHSDPWMATARSGTTAWVGFSMGARFRAERLAGGPTRVVAERDADTPELTVRHFLIDDVVPFLIARSGTPILHGAAVNTPSGALVLLSESGQGKSSLATSFALGGHPVLADDCVVIDRLRNEFLAQPSYPSIRLWDDSASSLLGARGRGRGFAHYTRKLRYTAGITFGREPLAVRGVVVLKRTFGGGAERLSIDALRGHDACAALLKGLRFLPRGPERGTIVNDVFDLATAVRVARVTIPADLDRLPAVRDALVRWAGT